MIIAYTWAWLTHEYDLHTRMTYTLIWLKRENDLHMSMTYTYKFFTSYNTHTFQTRDCSWYQGPSQTMINQWNNKSSLYSVLPLPHGNERSIEAHNVGTYILSSGTTLLLSNPDSQPLYTGGDRDRKPRIYYTSSFTQILLVAWYSWGKGKNFQSF